MNRPKSTIEARCKNCSLMMKNGNKMYCTKNALRRTFPYNSCLDFKVYMKGDDG